MARYVINNQPCDIVWEGLNEEQRILQNAKNLLMVKTGEIPYDRLRGLDRRMEAMPISLMQSEAAKRVHEALLWETRVRLIETNVSILGSGEILIEATVEV